MSSNAIFNIAREIRGHFRGDSGRRYVAGGSDAPGMAGSLLPAESRFRCPGCGFGADFPDLCARCEVPLIGRRGEVQWVEEWVREPVSSLSSTVNLVLGRDAARDRVLVRRRELAERLWNEAVPLSASEEPRSDQLVRITGTIVTDVDVPGVAESRYRQGSWDQRVTRVRPFATKVEGFTCPVPVVPAGLIMLVGPSHLAPGDRISVVGVGTAEARSQGYRASETVTALTAPPHGVLCMLPPR